MNLLLIAPCYPHPGLPFSGTFNEMSARTLTELGARVHVLAPRPYAPPLLSRCHRRWRAYNEIPAREIKNAIPVVRPRVPTVPWLRSRLWLDAGAFASVYWTARKIHRRNPFDAILAFDLVSAGGIAWRIARMFEIPAAGWATGGDVRFPLTSCYGKILRRAVENLDLVFYQSRELRQLAATLMKIDSNRLSADRHVILPRGIPTPPPLARPAVRRRVRTELGIGANEVLVLTVGRVSREKGIYELLESSALALAQNPSLNFRIIGAAPAFDDSEHVQQRINSIGKKARIQLLPACDPREVWSYLCAADIFAFPSHREGMPNSLLEAMAMGVASIAFAIPPVLEIDSGAGALATVPELDTKQFAAALITLADSPRQRRLLGARARRRVLERFVMLDNMREAMARLSSLVPRRSLRQTSAVSNAARLSV